MKILVTGSAGFIGSHLCHRLANQGFEILGIDNLNDYYDKNLKLARKAHFLDSSGVNFEEVDICDVEKLTKIFVKFNPECVVNLAAQAGVRYSKINPQAYFLSNLNGFTNLVELSRKFEIKRFVYASSSSVYGETSQVPFSETQNLNSPLSIYAATKLSNEIISYAYSKSFSFYSTGLRFFTVYGPWGRPDMAYFFFLEKILEGEEIVLFEKGQLLRDFTYIDDICESIFKIITRDSKFFQRHQIYNIGNSNPIKIIDLVKNLENLLGKKAKIIFAGEEPGEVKQTFSNSDKLFNEISYKPNTNLADGLKSFVKWHLNFYK